MTTIREALRRLFQEPQARPDQPADTLDRVDYSYRVFWTKQARGWPAARRRSIRAAARALAASDVFEPNAFERRYSVEDVDGEHSGASLLALVQVLEALDAVN